MDLFAHIDNYCERTDASLWSEPLNALSNLGFIVLGVLLWHQLRKSELKTELRLLAALMMTIGICSGLFHIFATGWGMLLDVASIALFILVYLYRYLRQIAAWPAWACWLGVVAFLVADRAIAALGSLGLNGSEGYLLPGTTLCLMAFWSHRHARAAVPWLAAATLLFVASFSLRTLDMALCEAWPPGTHFAWHLLLAEVLYCCIRAFAPASGMPDGAGHDVCAALSPCDR